MFATDACQNFRKLTREIPLMRRILLLGCLLLWTLPALAKTAVLAEPPILSERVHAGHLPPQAQRIPSPPLVADYKGSGRTTGLYGGTLRMLMARPADIRLMVVYGYARLVRYDRNFEIVPDILEKISIEDGRIFTLHLRKGHRWSDGAPFTSEDFRYYWDDVANNRELSPVGPPDVFRVRGELPRFRIIDKWTVEFTWKKPNPYFISALAQSRPIFIYRPAHYLQQFHARYGDRKALDAAARAKGVRNWAGVHNRLDNPYRFDNPDLPTLQPWVNTTALPAERFVFVRNPYFHRVDTDGKQLPYIDEVVVTIADKRLIPAKTAAGEADLQARYLRFDNVPLLKAGAGRGGYKVLTWKVGKGAHIALYPNLTINDPAWRDLVRDVRFRRALSIAINREELNKALFYGLAVPAQNTLLPDSPLYRREYQSAWAQYDIAEANALLDRIGLTKRDRNGVRFMKDGRPLEIIVETAGENTEEPDILQLIAESWRKIGIKLHVKPSHRDILRNRIYAGEAMMSISSGLENGLANADASPEELAPTRQVQYQWPKWGQFAETGGQAGEAPDMPEVRELDRLNEAWATATTAPERTRIWHRMLQIHADQVFVIGLISGTLQPVVVSNRLRNVPENGLYNWEPGANFGIYEPDTFWLVPNVGSL